MQKFLICLITNKCIIFLIVGSGNFGPAVAGPVPTPLHCTVMVILLYVSSELDDAYN